MAKGVRAGSIPAGSIPAGGRPKKVNGVLAVSGVTEKERYLAEAQWDGVGVSNTSDKPNYVTGEALPFGDEELANESNVSARLHTHDVLFDVTRSKFERIEERMMGIEGMLIEIKSRLGLK